MSKVNLALIRTDGGTQARVAINEEAIADYKDAIEAGTELPPVVVFFDGCDHWLADGFHRFFAYRGASRVSIPAWVRPGTQRDAVLFALGTNSDHGLRRSIADKHKAVNLMLDDPEWSKQSARQIAEHCNVSHTLVNTLLAARNTPAPTPAPSPTPTPAPAPAPAPTGKATGGASAPAGSGSASTPPTDAEKNAEAAHGGEDTDLGKLLDAANAELAQLQADIAAASADDLKAEVIKQRRIAEAAQRQQGELMDRVNQRDQELQRLSRTLARIGKAVGEDDPSKIAATVELFVRNATAAA